MVGLDAAGKTTILYKLKLGEIVTTIPTIGQSLLFLPRSLSSSHPGLAVVQATRSEIGWHLESRALKIYENVY